MFKVGKKKGRNELEAQPLTKREAESARAFDAMVRRLAALEAQTSLLIGHGLNLLDLNDGYAKLGYCLQAKYVQEVLGWGQAHGAQLARMARELRDRPHLCAGHLSALISYSGIRLVLGRTSALGEEVWADLVKRKTVPQIKKLLDAFDAAVLDEEKKLLGPAMPPDQPADFPQRSANTGDVQREQVPGEPGKSSASVADGSELSPEIKKRVAELAHRCVVTPGGVSRRSRDASDDDEPRGRLIQFNACPALAAEYDVALETLRRMEECELSDAECIELIIAEFMSGPGSEALCAHRGERERRSNATSAMGEGGSGLRRGVDHAGVTSSQERAGLAGGAGHGGNSSNQKVEGARAEEERERRSAEDGERERRKEQQRECRAFWNQVEADLAALSEHWQSLSWDPLALQPVDGLTPSADMDPFEIHRRLQHISALHRGARAKLRKALLAFEGGLVYRKLGFSGRSTTFASACPSRRIRRACWFGSNAGCSASTSSVARSTRGT